MVNENIANKNALSDVLGTESQKWTFTCKWQLKHCGKKQLNNIHEDQCENFEDTVKGFVLCSN